MFIFGDRIKSKSFFGLMFSVKKSQSLISSGLLKTSVGYRINLSDINNGLLSYADNTSKGKALIIIR